MTHLIQILLPRYDSMGNAFEPSRFETIKRELAEQFGGVTAYLRASAQGLWQADSGELVSDELAVFEIMAEEIDTAWWSQYREELERRFDQDEIVIRASSIRRL